MKRIFLVLLTIQAFAQGAFAYSVTFDLQADRLRSNAATSFPTTGLLLMVASTTNSTFGTAVTSGTSLAIGSFLDGTGGDDVILARFDLSSTATPGSLISGFTGSTDTVANLSSGDPFALYWFPALTLSTTVVPNTATSYGTYQTGNVAPLNGSAAWSMPSATASGVKLYFFTTDAVLTAQGSHTVVEATAAFSTGAVPEPGTYGIVLAGSAALFGFALRRKRTA